MKQDVQAVLNLIEDLGIEDDIFHALKSKSGKPSAVGKSFKPKKTSKGYEIYYDETSGEAVGIVYKNLVFLKTTSSEKINWHEAVKYCKTIIINGIVSEFCPVTEKWCKEFKSVSRDLYEALAEIGAENLDYITWCSEYGNSWAWLQDFSDGSTGDLDKYGYYYVRPVLVLDR